MGINLDTNKDFLRDTNKKKSNKEILKRKCLKYVSNITQFVPNVLRDSLRANILYYIF